MTYYYSIFYAIVIPVTVVTNIPYYCKMNNLKQVINIVIYTIIVIELVQKEGTNAFK